MELVEISGLLLLLLVALLAGGVWIAIALMACGFVGMQFVGGGIPAGSVLATTIWGNAASWTLAALPLFIWMGEILFRTRLSEEMFRGLAPWLNWIPGRLLHVNVLACGIFGSVSGSSAATCATVAKIALPELKKRGYDDSVSLGSLAGAGTLGILIPPSITMVVYAVAANVSIIQVFLAGFLPGLLVMALYSGYIAVWSLLHPERTPPPEPRDALQREAPGIGEPDPLPAPHPARLPVAAARLGDGDRMRRLGRARLARHRLVVGLAVVETLLAERHGHDADHLHDHADPRRRLLHVDLARLYGHPAGARDLGRRPAALSPYALIAALTVMYILLGTALDGISMIVLTTAVVIPMVKTAGFDLIWFGIFLVLVVEMAEVSPPVGFNLFVLQTMSGKDSNTVALAALPFFFLLVAAVAIITVFPDIVMYLPKLAFPD